MKLVLIYNADEGVFNAITDTIHKVLSPATYECQLCQYTFGLTSMHKRWRDFLAGINAEKVFLHRNEFQKLYPDMPIDLPAIFTEELGQLYPLLTADEIKECGSLNALITAVENRLPSLGSTF